MIRMVGLLLVSIIVSCTSPPDPEAELQVLAAQLASDSSAAVWAQLQPDSADYARIFREPPAVAKALAYGEAQWATQATMAPLPDPANLTIHSVSSISLRTGRPKGFPADYFPLAHHLHTETTLYALHYLDPKAGAPRLVDAFFRVNDRWVFIPQPYKAFR